ncbi:CcdB family protein [Brenneria sp. MC1SB4.1]|uniref:CcdB family protein n=2 Tax=Brenneria tiliae TaxID=2914984 RepID=A0ABT0MUX1_9GAMM|nr:CcdB family protein [Brenneria tiliae]
MASIRQTQIGPKVTNVQKYRQVIKNTIDFLLDGF